MVPCYKAHNYPVFGEIFCIIYCVSALSVHTYGVYPLYDIQRELSSITLEGTVSFQPLRSHLWSGQVPLLILIFLPRTSEPCYTVQMVQRHVTFLYNTCLTCFVYKIEKLENPEWSEMEWKGTEPEVL